MGHSDLSTVPLSHHRQLVALFPGFEAAIGSSVPDLSTASWRIWVAELYRNGLSGVFDDF